MKKVNLHTPKRMKGVIEKERGNWTTVRFGEMGR